MVIAMATVSLSPQQYQQMIDRIAGLESMMTNLQSHAESQQEQIRVAELVIQQLRTAGTPMNPPPPTRGTSLEQGLQRWTSSHKSGREICWTVTVDLGNHRRDEGERCA